MSGIISKEPSTDNCQPSTKFLKLSGLEPLVVTPETNFVNVG